MTVSNTPFRIWIAGSNEWLPGPQFNSLESAVASAQKLAASGEVAIELPTRHWHTFQHGEKFLGPANIELARGSQTNLAERASAALAGHPSAQAQDDPSRAYKLSIGRVRTVRRSPASAATPTPTPTSTPTSTPTPTPTPTASSLRVPVPAAAVPRRISSTHISTPHSIESATHEASVPMQSQTPSQQMRSQERRGDRRFDAGQILTEPTCAIDTKRTTILDISESGFRIAIPSGLRINVAGRAVLVFSGRHGFFELETKACWANAREAGMHIEEVSGNLVGRMFMRKMIAKWLERDRKRQRMNK